MKIGYARVSTEEQNLDLQLAALNTHKCEPIFSDWGISGARFERPGLKHALDLAKRGDTLVVWRLDRLGRSLSHLVEIVNDLSRRGVEFVSLTENIDTKSPTGMLIFHMIAALAEFERSLISERTRAGVAAARRRGARLGRPNALSEAQLKQARALLNGNSEDVVARTLNVHQRTLQRYLRAQTPCLNSHGEDVTASEIADVISNPELRRDSSTEDSCMTTATIGRCLDCFDTASKFGRRSFVTVRKYHFDAIVCDNRKKDMDFRTSRKTCFCRKHHPEIACPWVLAG